MAEPIQPASADRDGQQSGPADEPKQIPDAVAAGPEEPPDRFAGEQPGTGETTARDATPITTHFPWPRLARPDNVPDPSPKTETRDAPRLLRRWRIWIAAQVGGLALLLGGYLLGRAWPPAPPLENLAAADAAGYEAQKSRRTDDERALDAANRGLKAERSRDYQAAQTIYEEMINQQVPVHGAEYRLALLSLHRGDPLQAVPHLHRAVLAGDDVADCSLLLASLAGMKGNYADAATQLAAAVRAQPFNAKFCFCWGESLRRAGRLADAVERLTETLDRPDAAAARDLYLFKLRLARVETGGEDALETEAAGHVEQASPGGDWLLLSAAREIGRRNFALAAERLQQAKGTLPPEVFRVYAQDYLFQTQAARPELSAVLSVPPPIVSAPADAPLADPAVWTPAEADPAAWPPFPRAQ